MLKGTDGRKYFNDFILDGTCIEDAENILRGEICNLILL